MVPATLSVRYATAAPGSGVYHRWRLVQPRGRAVGRGSPCHRGPVDGLVGGIRAGLADAKTATLPGSRWRWPSSAWSPFVLLFLMFGSVLVPVKALVLNLLSLTATLGPWCGSSRRATCPACSASQPPAQLDVGPHPHVLRRLRALDGLRGVPPLPHQGGVRPHRRQPPGPWPSGCSGPADRHRGRRRALGGVHRLRHLGVTILKVFGIGLTLAVLLDATLVRGILVPAFMRLAGKANWWAPQWMRDLRSVRDQRESEAASSDRRSGEGLTDLEPGWPRPVGPAGPGQARREVTAPRGDRRGGDRPSGRRPGRRSGSITTSPSRWGSDLSSIYLHFASKNDVIFAACERLWQDFGKVLAEAPGLDGPVEHIRACGTAYLHFALDRPALYRVLFMSEPVDQPEDFDVQALLDNVASSNCSTTYRAATPAGSVE